MGRGSFEPRRTWPGRPAGGRKVRAAGVWACAAVWLTAAAGGAVWLERRAVEPGAPADSPAQWPAGTALRLAADRPTLVMFAHPHCPCSRASVAALADLVADRPGRVQATVVFYTPAGAPADWAEGELWRQAAAVPGVEVVADIGEADRRRFGARTSGQVAVYDPAGRLVAHGGLTPGRGRAGLGAGRAAVEAALAGRPVDGPAPVYGCPFDAPAE